MKNEQRSPVSASPASRGDSHITDSSEMISGLSKVDWIERRVPWDAQEALELATRE